MIIKCKCPECKGKGHFSYLLWTSTKIDEKPPKDLEPTKIVCEYCQGNGFYYTLAEEKENAG